MHLFLPHALWTAISAAMVVAGAALETTAPARTVVYVSNTESNDIHVLRLDRGTGELTLVEVVPIPGIATAGNSTPLAISPDRRVLYVGTRGEPKIVASFAIDRQTGKLRYLGQGPLVDSMPFIATDRTGRYLFAASYPGHKLTVSPIDAHGIVQPTQQVLEGHTNAHSILPDASNRHVLAMTLGNDRINQFLFDAKTGKLEPNTPPSVSVKEKTGPRHFAFHPNGRIVYVLGELDAAVHVFDYDAAAGRVREKQSVSGLPPGTTGRIAAADLHLTPDGRFLYSSERTSNTIASFRIDPADGTVALIESLPTEKMPRSFAIDSTGRYLYLVGQLSHRMTSYRIDPATGKLGKLREYPVGKGPNWVEILDLP